MSNTAITGFLDIMSPEALALQARIDAIFAEAGIANKCSTTLYSSLNKDSDKGEPDREPRLIVRATTLEKAEKVVAILRAANIRLFTSIVLSAKYYRAEEMVACNGKQ